MTKSSKIRELLNAGKSIKDIQNEMGMKDTALIYSVKKQLQNSAPSFKERRTSSPKPTSPEAVIPTSSSIPASGEDKQPSVFSVEAEDKKPSNEVASVNLNEEGKKNKEQLEKKFKIKFEYISSAGPMAINSAFKEYGLTLLSDEEKKNQIEAGNDALEYYLNVYSKYAVWINLGFAYGMPFISRIPEIVKLRAQQKQNKTNNNLPAQQEAPRERTVMGAKIDSKGHMLENPLLLNKDKASILKQFSVDIQKKEDEKNGNKV